MGTSFDRLMPLMPAMRRRRYSRQCNDACSVCCVCVCASRRAPMLDRLMCSLLSQASAGTRSTSAA